MDQIGGELILNPPTPLQWKALQECVVVHRNQLNFLKGNGSGDTRSATIDAAPIVAITDDATGVKAVNPPYSNSRDGGRYATLAAIVGITTNENRNENNSHDHIDEESFMEYMNLCPIEQEEDFIVPLSSSVRLVGVGRAVLRKYFYRLPSKLCLDQDNEGVALKSGYDIDADKELDDGYEDNTPIIIAEFEALIDDASIYSPADPDEVGEKGQRSYRCSPVHALSELNKISLRVSWMHDNRKTLVAGIKAARTRLCLYDDNLEDVDGLGILFEGDGVQEKRRKENVAGGASKKGGMSVDEFLATFKGNMLRIDPSELPQNQPSQLEKIESMENYGLNLYGAFSTISELTKVTSAQLEPYYSRHFQEREEYELEVSSFVAFRTLEGYADTSDMAWSLQCTSSVERLMRAYEIFLDHTLYLKKIAEKLSKELEECGEECTDLW